MTGSQLGGRVRSSESRLSPEKRHAKSRRKLAKHGAPLERRGLQTTNEMGTFISAPFVPSRRRGICFKASVLGW